MSAKGDVAEDVSSILEKWHDIRKNANKKHFVREHFFNKTTPLRLFLLSPAFSKLQRKEEKQR